VQGKVKNVGWCFELEALGVVLIGSPTVDIKLALHD